MSCINLRRPIGSRGPPSCRQIEGVPPTSSRRRRHGRPAATALLPSPLLLPPSLPCCWVWQDVPCRYGIWRDVPCRCGRRPPGLWSGRPGLARRPLLSSLSSPGATLPLLFHPLFLSRRMLLCSCVDLCSGRRRFLCSRRLDRGCRLRRRSGGALGPSSFNSFARRRRGPGRARSPSRRHRHCPGCGGAGAGVPSAAAAAAAQGAGCAGAGAPSAAAAAAHAAGTAGAGGAHAPTSSAVGGCDRGCGPAVPCLLWRWWCVATAARPL
ncbi:hypothetical protein PVAP13_1KG242610 [Panicum virgatum]|uniref:Uncharacterized protein n=1 Tax=Panicum virgatum TaxID=38727 RepID=A0A8T0XAI1_PANVG|nr:hypothetical protein PVAP13_1KG242610 [Panicum virgatum]